MSGLSKMPDESRTQIIRPDPDPTIRTWESLDREVRHVRELFETQLKSQDVRINAIEKASDVFQEGLTRVPTQVQQQVGNLRELHEEKFASVQTQFLERDTRTEQTSRDSKVAVDAALKAAGDAVEKQNAANQLAIAKSEAAFTKQIDLIGVQIETAKRAQDTQVGDIKDRLTRIEGRGAGYSSAWLIAVALVSALLGIGGLVLAVVR